VASLTAEIVAKLSSGGVGSTSATGTSWRLVERELLPGTLGTSTAPRQIAVVPTGGFPWEPEELLDRPTFQLLFRDSATGSTGLEAKVASAIACLTTSPDWTVLGRRYVDVQMQGNMLWLGRDENQRPLMSQNFLAWRSRTT
jgi:Bacteriophage minor capsid protein